MPVAPVVPAVPPSPGPSSRASSRDISRRSRDPKSRTSESAAAHAKRRSTMNSRDAAYDEEELIRRAIEESKAETKSNADETDTHLGKRSRSDSVTCVFSSCMALARIIWLTSYPGTENERNVRELLHPHLAPSRGIAI